MMQLETLRFAAAHAARIDEGAAILITFEDAAADRHRNRAYALARRGDGIRSFAGCGDRRRLPLRIRTDRAASTANADHAAVIVPTPITESRRVSERPLPSTRSRR